MIRKTLYILNLYRHLKRHENVTLVNVPNETFIFQKVSAKYIQRSERLYSNLPRI